MKNLLLFAAVTLNITAAAQTITGSDIVVVSSRTVDRTAPQPNNDKQPSCIPNYDHKTNMFMAEPEYECIYNYTINNPAKGDTIRETTACVLQIGDGIGRFCDYTTFSVDSANHQVDRDEDAVNRLLKREMQNDYYFEEIVYQNYPAGKMTVYGIIAPSYFIYEEDGNPVEWVLTEDTDTVCGYECMKATGSYGGRQWEVWFAPEIPVAMGPWKCCGLPGLVMKAKDSDNLHLFEAISFRKGNMPVYKPMWPDPVKTERVKFVKQKNATPDPMQNIMPESIRVINVYKGDHGQHVISVNGVPIRQKANGYVPRELE